MITTVMAAVAIALYFTHYDQSVTRSTNELSVVLKSEQRTIFDPVLPDKSVSLPRDFKLHPNFQHEWWHLFATVQDKFDNNYHIQWSFFRVATDEREMRGWQDPHLYISNIVVTHHGRTHKEQRVARGGIGQAGMVNTPFRVWIDNWSWRSLGSTPFPGNLSVATDDFAVDLEMFTNGPFVMNGDKGYQVKHELESVASFSFSAPFLGTRGRLIIDGKPIMVEGKAWMQKEWGTGLIGEEQQGWDWFVFNLEDGRALTVSQYRHNSQLPYVFGTLSTKSGHTVALSDEDISIRPLQTTTLLNGRRLPLQWIINVPEHNLNLTTRIVRRDMWLPFVMPYWEGPIMASGSDEARGFMQLTGY